jgi:hypothetical protein
MRLLHTAARTRATFGDPNLVSHAGLVPAVRLAENVGLEGLVAEHVHVAAKVGANPEVKMGSLSGTYPRPGPGNTPGTARSTPPTAHHRPWPPDLTTRPARAQPETPQWTNWMTGEQIPHARAQRSLHGDQLPAQE